MPTREVRPSRSVQLHVPFARSRLSSIPHPRRLSFFLFSVFCLFFSFLEFTLVSGLSLSSPSPSPSLLLFALSLFEIFAPTLRFFFFYPTLLLVLLLVIDLYRFNTMIIAVGDLISGHKNKFAPLFISRVTLFALLSYAYYLVSIVLSYQSTRAPLYVFYFYYILLPVLYVTSTL